MFIRAAVNLAITAIVVHRTAMRLAIIFLLGCSNQSAPPVSTTGSDATGSPPAIPKPAAAAPLAEKTLVERKDATPYTIVTANLTAFGKLDAGHGISLADDQPATGIVAGARQPDGSVTSWSLFGVDGRTLATFGAYYTGSPRLDKAVVGLADERIALLDAKTGAITSPEISLPGGAAVEQMRIALDDAQGRVWVFAKSKDGKAYAGTWDDLAQARVTLATPLAGYPERISTEQGVLAWSGDRPHGCGLIALAPGAPPLCAPDEPLDFMISGDELVAGRYWIGGGMGNVIVTDAKTKTEVPLVANCTGTSTRLTLQPATSRVLAACGTDSGAVQLVLWSPTGTWATTTSRFKLTSGWTLSGKSLDFPVTPIESFFGKQPPYTDWIDVATATIYKTPPFAPVMYSDYGGMPVRFLAQDPAKRKELWVVDLGAGTYERIATDLECKHELQIGYETADRVALVCALQTGVGFAARGGWTDLIDFTARKRTRIKDVALTDVHASGRAAGLTLTSPMRVVAVP